MRISIHVHPRSTSREIVKTESEPCLSCFGVTVARSRAQRDSSQAFCAKLGPRARAAANDTSCATVTKALCFYYPNAAPCIQISLRLQGLGVAQIQASLIMPKELPREGPWQSLVLTMHIHRRAIWSPSGVPAGHGAPGSYVSKQQAALSRGVHQHALSESPHLMTYLNPWRTPSCHDLH